MADLSLSNIHTSFGRTEVITGLDLEVNAGVVFQKKTLFPRLSAADNIA
ncbi:hypothetical protein [Labedella phragmitis]|nr:hypothetical protein [Labedella phragmitis]